MFSENMAKNEASHGDRIYMNYKNDMEGSLSSPHSTVGVAIFGLGRIGTIHLETIRHNSRAQLLYCIEESTERVEAVRRKCKLMERDTVFLQPSEEDKVFNDPRVDAVVICTPTFTHEHLVLRSLESGKAVFCEKPLSVSEEGIEKCLKASKKYSKPLMCAFNRRFDPGLRHIKTRVDSGELGQLKMVKCCARDSPKPSMDYLRISGGIYHDCCVHDIDFICWILGEFPDSVSSYAHTFFEDIKEIGDFDSGAIIMKFPSGTVAVIDFCRHAAYGYDQRSEVFGSKGMLTCGEQRPTGVKHHDAKGATAVPIFFSFASTYQESYVLEMEHFLNVAQGTEECYIKGESILAVSKIASACEKSAKTGKTVSLSWENK